MIFQTPPHKTRGLLWEFVGGKVEEGESRESALKRECKEEIAVEILVHDVFLELDHVYPDINIHLTIYNAEIVAGELCLVEHNDIRWILPAEIPQYQFCPADQEILKIIQTLYM